MVVFQSKGWQAWDPGRAGVLIQVWSQAKAFCLSLLLGVGRVSPFVLCRLSTDWIWTTHNREGNLFYSINWFQCYSHPKITLMETNTTIFNQISGQPMAQSIWHIKLTIIDTSQYNKLVSGTVSFSGCWLSKY